MSLHGHHWLYHFTVTTGYITSRSPLAMSLHGHHWLYYFTVTTGNITLATLRENYKLLTVKKTHYLRFISFDAEVYNILGYCGV